VTGGSGFIGTHLGQALLDRGGGVRLAIHRRDPIIADARAEIVRADLTRQEECLKAMRGVNLVLHAAGAISGVGVTAAGAMAGIATNLNLTAQVLQAAWTSGVERVLIFSSSTVYPASDHPIREEELQEQPPFPAYAGYGRMRRYLEHLAEFVAARSNVKIALVRPTAVYGPHDDFNPTTGHVVPSLVRKAVEKLEPFEVWGTGDEVRDFLHAGDFARGCLLALEKHAVCDPINLGSGAGVTIRQVVDIILQAAGHSGATVRFDPSKPSAIPVRLVDTAKAKQMLGFEPTISIEDGLRDLVRWYASHQHGTVTPPN